MHFYSLAPRKGQSRYHSNQWNALSEPVSCFKKVTQKKKLKSINAMLSSPAPVKWDSRNKLRPMQCNALSGPCSNKVTQSNLNQCNTLRKTKLCLALQHKPENRHKMAQKRFHNIGSIGNWFHSKAITIAITIRLSGIGNQPRQFWPECFEQAIKVLR